jgi:thioesterase domain-containing protein
MVFELARQIRVAGKQVELLIMVDSAPPSFCVGQRSQPGALKTVSTGGVHAATETAKASQRIAATHLNARASYVIREPFDGQLAYLLCRGEAIPARRDPRRHWRHLAMGGIRLLPLPGRHGAFHEEPQFSAFSATVIALLNGSATNDGNCISLFGRYRLRVPPRPAQHTIIAPDGAELPVPGQTGGQLLGVRMDTEQLQISGWAADPDSIQPADTVLAFINGHYLGQGGCGHTVPQEARQTLDSTLRYAGFDLLFPLPRQLWGIPAMILQLYVMSHDRSIAWMLGHYRLQTTN